MDPDYDTDWPFAGLRAKKRGLKTIHKTGFNWNRMMTANALDKSASPFLQQHKDNPVAWRIWSDAVLAEAKAQNKPIFLSIGYPGCHGSQTMNRESFSDPETAQLINDNFIPVLLDREERPDIDQVYQAASTIMGHVGGWPLNLFLNADGVPISVGGFVSNIPAGEGRTFKSIVGDIITLIKDRPEEAANNSAQVMERMNVMYNSPTHGSLESIQMEMTAIRIGQRYDIFMGGLTGPNKFPTVGLLEVSWRAFLRTGLAQFMHIVSTTMNSLLLGGIYDHVGGGFFRYTMDERWMIPHFEKSTSDNALLISFMTSMWQFNRNELCRQRVAETVDWLLREMRLEGGFAASLSSASEGEEGRFYVWSEAEIDAALAGTFSARFKQVYGVKREGDFNGKIILRRFAGAPATEADETLMTKQRAMLLDVRDKRVRPERDNKLLTDANGLAIRALAFAGSAFEKPEWIAAAVSAYDAIVQQMENDGALSHAWANGQRLTDGFADDYVRMAEAALQLYESTGEKRYIEQARKWVAVLDGKFWDDLRGGYNLIANGAEQPIVRPRAIFDQPTPSANGSMISVLTRLALITGEEAYGLRAQAIVLAFAGEFNRNWLSCGEFLNGFETFATGLQMVVVGDKSRTQELVRAVWGKAMPNRLLVQVEKSDELPANHPVFGKPMENGRPTVYLCQRNACSEPITSAVALAQALTLPQQRTAASA